MIATVVAANMLFTDHVLTRPSLVYMVGMTSYPSTGGAYQSPDKPNEGGCIGWHSALS